MSYYVAADNNFMTTSSIAKSAAFAISVWTKLIANSPGSSGTICASTSPGTFGYWTFKIDNGATVKHGQPGGIADHATTFALSSPNNPNASDLTNWSHLLWNYDGSTPGGAPEMYLNGTLISTSGQNSSGAISTSTAAWQLFRRDVESNKLDAYLAHLAFFDRKLSSGQITQLAGGKNPMDAANVGTNPIWYNMMTNGLSGNDSGTINAQVGTLTNSGATLFPSDNPTVDPPPAPTLTKKWQIPTSVTDGTVRKIWVYSDTGYATALVSNQSASASGGLFKVNDSGLTVGQKRPCVIVSHGADDTVPARGGPAWATGIQE